MPELRARDRRRYACAMSKSNAAHVRAFQREHTRAAEKADRERLRAKDRTTLATLQQKIAAAKLARAQRMREVVQLCRSQRVKRTESAKQRREALRELLRAERIEDRGSCAASKDRTREEAARTIEGAAVEARDVRDLARMRRGSKSSAPAGQPRGAARAAELRAESDDEVRGNIDRELVPVWEARRRLTHPTERASRTEKFLEWVEENSATVNEIMHAHHERELRRLLAEEKRLTREMKKAGRYSGGAVAHRLASHAEEWGPDSDPPF